MRVLGIVRHQSAVGWSGGQSDLTRGGGRLRTTSWCFPSPHLAVVFCQLQVSGGRVVGGDGSHGKGGGGVFRRGCKKKDHFYTLEYLAYSNAFDTN